MRTTFIERIFQRHFGVRAEPIVESFVTSPQMDAVLAEMDAKEVARRRDLVARLTAAPQRHEARCAEAARQKAAAEKDVVAARAALEAAMDRHMQATSIAVGAGLAYEHDKAQLQRELESTADPRLESFAASCQSICDVLRHYKPKEIHQPAGSRVRIVLDPTEINAAMAALTSAAAEARGMKLQAMTFAEITAALEAVRAELLPKLQAAGFREAPATDGVNAEAIALH